MAEDRSTISSARITPYDVSRASFTLVRRGFDSQEVRSFLELVSRELEACESREADLRRAVAEADERARNPVIDEAMLTSSLGQQSAQVLRAAHEEARVLLESAQAQATEMVQGAHHRASALTVDAEQKAAGRIGDAEVAAGNLESDAQATAQKILAQARTDGEMLVARAHEQGRAMIDQAQEARNRVLADQNARRRMMHLQIEQLRAARDRLATSILDVRETVDRLTEEISHSDDAARAAAQEVARRQPTAQEVERDAMAEALDETASGPAPGDESLSDQVTAPGDDGLFDESAAPPEPGLVEELFAKIRASAHDEVDEPPARSTSEPHAEVPVPSGPDTQAMAARDAAISASRSTLARKVKRSLQDEQNRLLDALRASNTHDASLLDPEETQLSALAAASVDPLRDAADAGRSFAVDRGVHHGLGLSDGAVVSIAQSLAVHIVGPLRRRLEGALVSDDPTSEVNAAFREWRGTRLERFVGDAALEAFSAAVIAVIADGGARWVAGGVTSPCPDCADNALAGTVQAGSTFPTGQAYPPAHAGCRCLILPVLT